MNLLNSLGSSGPPQEGEGKMKRGEIESDREEIKDLKAIDFLLSHCGCLLFGGCGVSKGLRWVFSGKQPACRAGGTGSLDSPTSYLRRIPTETPVL